MAITLKLSFLANVFRRRFGGAMAGTLSDRSFGKSVGRSKLVYPCPWLTMLHFLFTDAPKLSKDAVNQDGG
jgi:hypothetical protein